LIILWLGW